MCSIVKVTKACWESSAGTKEANYELGLGRLNHGMIEFQKRRGFGGGAKFDDIEHVWILIFNLQQTSVSPFLSASAFRCRSLFCCTLVYCLLLQTDFLHTYDARISLLRPLSVHSVGLSFIWPGAYLLFQQNEFQHRWYPKWLIIIKEIDCKVAIWKLIFVWSPNVQFISHRMKRIFFLFLQHTSNDFLWIVQEFENNSWE